MTSIRALEGPLRAWRSFRDVARATRTLAAANALSWGERARHADDHLRACEHLAREHPLPARDPGAGEPGLRPRVVLAIGTDLGLCGPLNARLAELCRSQKLAEAPTILRVVVGARLAAAEPLGDAVELPAPSSVPAARRLAGKIEDVLDRLPDPLALELTVVLAAEVEGDGHPRVELRRPPEPSPEPLPGPGSARGGEVVLLDDADEIARAAHRLDRHARLVASLCRAIASEHEARWRTMTRAYESSERKIAEQERRLRRLRQELITQEMLEVRAHRG